MPEIPTCHFKAYSDDKPIIHTGYDNGRFEGFLALTGRLIDNHDNFSGDSAFHNKPIRIELHTGSMHKALGDFAEKEGVKNACGGFVVAKGAEPEKFEVEGHPEETEPLLAILYVDVDTFIQAERLITRCFENNIEYSFHFVIGGRSLPDISKKGRFASMKLSDFDISSQSEYIIASFKVIDRGTKLPAKRVSYIEQKERTERVRSTFTVSEAKFHLEMPSASFRHVSCTGKLRSNYEPLKNLETTIGFEDHERDYDSYSGYKKKDFAGTFLYIPVGAEDVKGEPHFSATLNSTEDDLANLVVPLLKLDLASSTILIELSLDISKSQLTAVTERHWGKVLWYSWQIYKTALRPERKAPQENA